MGTTHHEAIQPSSLPLWVYDGMPFDRLCTLADASQEDAEAFTELEHLDEAFPLIGLYLRKIRRILREIAEWSRDADIALQDKNLAWAKECYAALGELGEDYHQAYDELCNYVLHFEGNA